MTLYIVGLVLIIIGIIFKLFFTRSVITKHKYIRLTKYHDDMSETIKYIKRDKFNLDNDILINSKHIYNCNGYTSLIITSNAQETINPIDFESKYDPKQFKTAMKSKLINETFASLKTETFDKMMFLIILNGLTLLAVVYLVWQLIGGNA